MTLSQEQSIPNQPVDLTSAAEKACNAVVYIKVVTNGKTQTIEYRDPFEDFFGDFFGRGGGGTQRRQIQTPKREGSGSGVIISSDGYIVTNNHVVENADNITITLNDNREFTAKTIGTDPTTDLALLKIEGTDFPTLVIGDSDALKVGEWVLAVGNPFNLTSTVTAGIVSAKARHLGANGIESFIQTDAAINQGNSGGALVNARGELVGINAMLYSQTGSYSGYGFAIPTTIMKKVVTDIDREAGRLNTGGTWRKYKHVRLAGIPAPEHFTRLEPITHITLPIKAVLKYPLLDIAIIQTIHRAGPEGFIGTNDTLFDAIQVCRSISTFNPTISRLLREARVRRECLPGKVTKWFVDDEVAQEYI
jgi:S1-C subfamily serine protease